MDFTKLQPLLELREQLLGDLATVASRPDKSAVALMKKVFHERDRIVAAVAASKTNAGRELQPSRGKHKLRAAAKHTARTKTRGPQ